MRLSQGDCALESGEFFALFALTGQNPKPDRKAVFYLLFDRLWWAPWGGKRVPNYLWGLDMWRVLVVKGNAVGTRRWP